MTYILPGSCIGIIGGGQLGRMMALAAKEAGFSIAVLDPDGDAPCAQVADFVVEAPYDNEGALSKLAEFSDVITYEFENIDADSLGRLAERAYIPQGAELVRVAQDRRLEKQAIRRAGVPVAPYIEAETYEQLCQAIDRIGYPCIVKTARGGYDGKGQVRLRGPSDRKSAELLFAHSPCVAEAVVPFVKEVSVIVQRSTTGDIACLPVAENIHVNHILHETILPARIEEKTAAAAREAALQIAHHLELIGTLAVEMFVLEDGSIVVNELAPRPHNSGHVSIEACHRSQFHQHIRAICGWPLAPTIQWSPAVMVNVLGQHVDPLEAAIAKYPHWSVHLYGKSESKHNRKMGHVTVTGDSIESILRTIQQSGIWPIEGELARD